MNYIVSEDTILDIGEALPLEVMLLLILFSYIGSIYIIATAATGFSFFISRKKRRRLLLTIISAYSVFVLLKPLADTSRPSVNPFPTDVFSDSILQVIISPAIRHGTGGVPSGHATASTVFILCLIYEFNLYKKSKLKSLILGTSYILMVTSSRVLLGTHFIIDVLSGFLLGVFLFVTLYGISEKVSYKVHNLSVLAIILATLVFSPRLIDGVIILAGYIVIYSTTTEWFINIFSEKKKEYFENFKTKNPTSE